MDAASYRVAFEYTLDEIVAVYLEYVLTRPVVHRARRRARLAMFVACAAGAVYVGVREYTSPGSCLFCAMLALTFGVAAATAYIGFYEWQLRRMNARAIREHYHNDAVVACEVEFRTGGLWTRTRGIELMVPWSGLERVEDGRDGVKLWLETGLVVLPTRVFRNREERDHCLTLASRLAGNPVGS